MTYPKVLILVEGQTEETVVGNLIAPHLRTLGCYETRAVILETKRAASGQKYRGGVSTWPRIRGDLRRLLNDSSATVVTTLIDYYGFPPDAPGMAGRPTGTCYLRVKHVETALVAAINDHRFVPHLVLHELETWLLASREWLARRAQSTAVGAELDRVVDECGGPELVDDGPQTSPSKRIANVWPQYQKVNHGPPAISDLGMSGLRIAGPHADRWLSAVEDQVRGVTNPTP